MANDGPAVIDVPREAYPELSKTMQRYRERDVDFADAALVWLAEQTGNRSILTVDLCVVRSYVELRLVAILVVAADSQHNWDAPT